MKRLLTYLVLAAVMIMTSCNDQNPSWKDNDGNNDKNIGTLSFNCFTSLTANTKVDARVTKAGEYIYAIEVRNVSTNDIVFTATDHTQITNGIKLQAGNYIVKATTGSLDAKASFSPCYSGSENVTIAAGQITNVTITTTLANVKVSAFVEQAVVDFFQDYDLVISNKAGGILDYASDKQTVGYFVNSGTIQWTLTAYYADGSSRVFTNTFTNTQPRDHYTLKFKLGDPVSDSEMEVNHTVEQINDSYEISISGGSPSGIPFKVESANAWAKFAYLNGSYSGEVPSDIAFEYKAEGASEWTTLAPLTMDANVITGKVLSLTPKSNYQVRLGTTSDKSAPVAFTTEDTPDIENMNMDTWTQNGKNWYANSKAEDVFWGSGNEGVTGFLAGSKPSNTTPTDDARSGKAARLESIKVNVVNFAAGNLFTGSFEVNYGKPLDSPSFGQPYTGRPTELSFWYKYLPNQWNTPAENDKCTVYILLGTWSGQIKSSQIKGIDTEGCIAYGSFVSDATVDTYTKQTINIQYKDLVTKPTRIIIVASSSLRGEEYKGALGSTLFLDDFEFGWE